MESPKPYREQRPWGEFEEFTKNKPSTVKIITIKQGEALSLQFHHHRDEFWHILSGAGIVEVGNESVPAQAGQEFFVPRGTKHRLKGGVDSDLSVLEIAFGDFDEKDIVRTEDKYGRT